MRLGEDAFHGVNDPVEVDGQRASGLRFADAAVQALLSAALVFRLLPRGFSNRDCDHWASLLGKAPDDMTPGQITYHLRRLLAQLDRADPGDSPLPSDEAGLAHSPVLHSHI